MSKVAFLTPETEAEYCALLLGNPQGLIYSTLEFRNFLCEAVEGEPRYLVAFDGNGKIVGGLPLIQRQVPGVGVVINSLPWYGSHGGLILSPDAPAQATSALLNAYDQLVKGPEVLTATLILSPFDEDKRQSYCEALTPSTLDHRIGQITELPNLDTNLESVLTQKTRNLARKSRKQGFEIRRDASDFAWEFLYTVHQENMLAIGGKAKPREHFDALRRNLPEEWRQISIATLNGEPVAALLLLFYNKTVEYFTPVIKQEYRSLQPLSFLIWNGMVDAVEKGFRWWNWGGTWVSQKTLHHFKAGWGAKDYPYSYLVNASSRGMDALQSDRDSVARAFPYFYVFPFDQLSG